MSKEKQMNQTPGGDPGEQPATEPRRVQLKLRPSDDAMSLEISFERVSSDDIPLTFEEVMEIIENAGVVKGVDDNLIRALCSKPIYGRPFVVARGRAPKTGKDGYLNYLVETSRELRPKMMDNGIADYRDLGFTQNVQKGQPLVEIHFPEKGADGYDIYGNIREGRFGKDPNNPLGKNTEKSEDGKHLIAKCDGTVEVKRGFVDVHEVLRIDGNVDNATGDVHFVGDIFISGDVVSGFSVSTTNGHITIKGSVESATIQASGDIVVGEGINGMNRGSIEAGGSIKCQYIQSCFIKAGEDIYADSVMYCNIECAGNVELKGKRAALIGGRSSIRGNLICKSIGTDSHVSTYINMDNNAVDKAEELKAVSAELGKIDEETYKIVQVLSRYEDLMKQGHLNSKQRGIILQVKDSYDELSKRRAELLKKQEEIKQEQLLASQNLNYIECYDKVNVGVQVTFGPLMMSVQTPYVFCRIGIAANNIAITSLK